MPQYTCPPEEHSSIRSMLTETATIQLVVTWRRDIYVTWYLRRNQHGGSCEGTINELSKPVVRFKSYGARCFEFAAAEEWNKLDIRVTKAKSLSSFKRSLKTTLFE